MSTIAGRLEATEQGYANLLTSSTILVVDDEPQIRRVLRASLQSQGVKVLDAQNGEEALEHLRTHHVDLILLDMNMPGMGGLDTCRAIRNAWNMPIIVVSVKDTDKDKVEALDAGADDYVTKPFSFDELLARIRAALRRSGFSTDPTPKQINLPGLEVDFERRRVVVNGQLVRLTPTEFDILRYLVSQANRPVPHKTLLQAIWGPDYGDQVEYLRVFINQLRKKIEPSGDKPIYIMTEPRIGYRFALPASGSASSDTEA